MYRYIKHDFDTHLLWVPIYLPNFGRFYPKIEWCEPGEIQPKLPSCNYQHQTAEAPYNPVVAPKYTKVLQSIADY